MKNILKASKFLDWYLSDWDKSQYVDFTKQIFDEIKITGNCIVTVQEIFDNLEYIPSHICEILVEEQEYEPNEVFLIIHE